MALEDDSMLLAPSGDLSDTVSPLSPLGTAEEWRCCSRNPAL